MNKPFRIVLFLGLIIILLELLKIQLLNNLSVENIDYTSLTSQLETTRKQNMTLHDTLLLNSSYHTIEQKAQQKGFKQAPIIYLQFLKQ